MKIKKTDNNSLINKMRSELYKTLVAPIDAMWEQLYISSSQHFVIENETQTIGYCCINDDKYLLQIYLKNKKMMDKAINYLIETGLMKAANLSSNEPVSFNACLALSKSIRPNSFCFEYEDKAMKVNSPLNIEMVATENIPTVKEFMKQQIGFDDTFGYTENLVNRKELFMVRDSEIIIATSECRMSDSQPEIADIGVIVNTNNQGAGIATKVIRQQVARVLEKDRKPICSTTYDNIASRKAIERAGFYCSNIIFDIDFINHENPTK